MLKGNREKARGFVRYKMEETALFFIYVYFNRLTQVSQERIKIKRDKASIFDI